MASRRLRRFAPFAVAFALAAGAAHGAGPVPSPLRLDLASRLDPETAWLEPLAPAREGLAALDERVPVQAFVLERLVERGAWPASLTVTLDGEPHTVAVPKAARANRALTLRLAEPRALRSLGVDDGDERLLETFARVRPLSAAELRGDTLESLLPKVVGAPAERVQVAAIMEHAAEPAYEALGRQWRSLEPPAQLTLLDRLGASRCTAGLAFLARLVVEGGEAGERAERLLGACGPRAAEGLAVRFQSLDPAHRAKLAPVFARTDAAKAFQPLLEATTTAEGAARRSLRAALAQSVRKLSAALLREKLEDGALPLEVRLTLAAAVPADAHAADLASIARDALASSTPTARRRGTWLVEGLPLEEKQGVREALLTAYGREESAATREAMVEALGLAATDDDLARFLDDLSPTVRARAATLAERAGRTSVAPCLRAHFAGERWLEPATAMARALATLAPNEETQALLRKRHEEAKNSAFAAVFLEARAAAGDRRVLTEARKIVRDDRALVDLRIAAVHAFRMLGDRSLNGDLVRLARRALEPLTEDDGPLAYACLEALTDLAEAGEREKLRPLLASKDPGLRHAVKALLAGDAGP